MKANKYLTNLSTPWMEQPEISWNEYPRPQLRRDSFLCLNGKWNLSCNGLDWGEILVPYPPESQLSGICKAVGPKDVLIYRRNVTIPEGFNRGRVLLHFGAVDQICKIWWNGELVGEHEGGYLPFSFDVTEYLAEENELRVGVVDALDHDYPYGKQRHDRGGMWYTPVSGIWQTVWMESVPENHIKSIRIDTDLESVTLRIRGGDGQKVLMCDGKRYLFEGNAVRFRPENPRLWTPEEPNLYPFTIEVGEDKIESYFALRTIGSETVDGLPRLTLNGKPYFFHGLLDQGYFSDGIYLPGSPEGYTFDVQTMKDLGFNTLRKHIKIEPERFYYDCDRLGMVVFQDLVNSGDYYYIVDTVLPNGGIKKGITHKASPKRAEIFESTAKETLDHLHNHPSILYYTLFNEGWGQYDEQRLYETMKKLEPDRIWDATSGWFWNCDSDVLSEHIYFGGLEKMKPDHRPLVLSEFGGYSCGIEGHRFNLKKVYGYKKYENPAHMEAGLMELYRTYIIPKVSQGLSAAILTQVSDVEDETNGLVTYDRQVVKVSPENMQKIAKELEEALKPALQEV